MLLPDCTLWRPPTRSTCSPPLLPTALENTQQKTNRAEECRFSPSSKAFAVGDDRQNAEALAVAERLRGGAALKFAPCDLWAYLRGRTLWLIG